MRRLPAIGLLLLLAAGCSEPPQKEINQAQGAIDAARAAGADQYAVDEYTAATSALQKAHDAVDQRDYRQALSYALDARERAQDAARQAADGKARARITAENAFSQISARAQQLETRIKTAEAARVAARELQKSRATLAETRKALQEARTAIDSGNYADIESRLAPVRTRLEAALTEVEGIPQRPARRRRS
jgi:ABC-type oligopeptide transport system substrate-binding subunit